MACYTNVNFASKKTNNSTDHIGIHNFIDFHISEDLLVEKTSFTIPIPTNNSSTVSVS